jgi:aminocarboxymuconate-semialdehyde decarboxylase
VKLVPARPKGGIHSSALEDQLALGTDYPFPLGEDHPGKMIEEMDSITADQKRRLLGGTALEFLGIESAVFHSDATGTT